MNHSNLQVGHFGD